MTISKKLTKRELAIAEAESGVLSLDTKLANLNTYHNNQR
jgi:hypothetical protein